MHFFAGFFALLCPVFHWTMCRVTSYPPRRNMGFTQTILRPCGGHLQPHPTFPGRRNFWMTLWLLEVSGHRARPTTESPPPHNASWPTKGRCFFFLASSPPKLVLGSFYAAEQNPNAISWQILPKLGYSGAFGSFFLGCIFTNVLLTFYTPIFKFSLGWPTKSFSFRVWPASW